MNGQADIQRDRPSWLRTADIWDLFRLSAPIAVSRLSWMLMGLTDAIVLGQVAGQEHELAFVLNLSLIHISEPTRPY